jgi:rare lipoprotein A
MSPEDCPVPSFYRSAVLSLLVLLLVAGCATKKGPSGEPTRKGDEQRWLASWYGKKYHGRPTASGERFNMHKVSAAHRTLPLGSVVRVTNLDNGRTLKVRINDRGPFVDGRIIDLSYKAAKKLDMVKAGIVPVRLVVQSVP